jgi:hypothetical protein
MSVLIATDRPICFKYFTFDFPFSATGERSTPAYFASTIPHGNSAGIRCTYVGLRDDIKQEVTIWDINLGHGSRQMHADPALAWWLPKFPEK